MRKALLFWVADYAAGIAAALSLGLLVGLGAAWITVFRSRPILAAVSTALSALIIAILIRAVPYVRKRADDRRLQQPEESLSGLLRDMKEARAKREQREQLERLRARRR